MRNNQYFNAMQKEFDAMTDDEILENSGRSGKNAAFGAWREGNRQNLDFPYLSHPLYEDEISEFLGTLEEAGFKKFVFFAFSGNAVENLAEFWKAGWKLTGTFEIDDGLHEAVMVDGLVFEK